MIIIKRIMYKLKRYNKLIQVLGIILSVIGLVLVLKIIPIKIWLFVLGLMLIAVGWFLFRL